MRRLLHQNVYYRSREKKEGSISPDKLFLEISFVCNFVNFTENYTRGYKYNSNHLNELAKIPDCSISDFYSPKYVGENCIEEYHEIREWKRQEIEQSKKQGKTE